MYKAIVTINIFCYKKKGAEDYERYENSYKIDTSTGEYEVLIKETGEYVTALEMDIVKKYVNIEYQGEEYHINQGRNVLYSLNKKENKYVDETLTGGGIRANVEFEFYPPYNEIEDYELEFDIVRDEMSPGPLPTKKATVRYPIVEGTSFKLVEANVFTEISRIEGNKVFLAMDEYKKEYGTYVIDPETKATYHYESHGGVNQDFSAIDIKIEIRMVPKDKKNI